MSEHELLNTMRPERDLERYPNIISKALMIFFLLLVLSLSIQEVQRSLPLVNILHGVINSDVSITHTTP